jgi:drug/metabolite transporter (DMT)-like permease
MFWILIAIFSYFLLALVALVDKYLVSGPIPGAKIYAFYVGLLGVGTILLIPFVGFSAPDSFCDIGLALLAGSVHVVALFALFSCLREFEVSRIVPAVGAISPIFVISLGYLLSGVSPDLDFKRILALFLLILGGFLINIKKGRYATIKSIEASFLTAFLFALFLILTKLVYFLFPFWTGFIWMRIGGFAIALLFLFSKEVREEIFKNKVSFNPKTIWIFLGNQAMGGFAFLLQNFAIILVPLGLLSFINALEGIKYVFVLALSFIISFYFPGSLKEETSKNIILQKAFAVILIIAGLIIIGFNAGIY